MSWHANNNTDRTQRRGNSFSSPGLSGGSTTLAAVALQDQLMRNLSLTDPLRKRPQLGRKPTPSWKKNIKSTIDTGLVRKTSPKKHRSDDREYVLDAKLPPATLAQKLGLVEAPRAQLSEEDWGVVKLQSNRREDSKQPCVICKEEFGTEQQVLLSCTHVFHRACLESFERFTGKKTCPLCRKDQYQKRVIHEGARHHRQVSATRIQAAWRGFVVRKWYQKLRETVPPKDPLLRQKFYENKLKTITDRMVNSYDTDVNSFLRDLDRSLEASRNVFQHFDEVTRAITEEQWAEIQLKAVERGSPDCPICLNPLDGCHGISLSDVQGGPEVSKDGGNLKKGSCGLRQAPAKNTNLLLRGNPNNHQREPLNVKAGSREVKATSESKDAGKVIRKTVLLSCSHVFHQTCLEALEEFAVGERRFVCPVCRTSYQKRVM